MTKEKEMTKVASKSKKTVEDTIIKQNELTKVYTTKEMAEKLGMTGKQLRRHLRAMDSYNDGIYTRYAWTKQDFDRICKAVVAKQAKKEKTNKEEGKA